MENPQTPHFYDFRIFECATEPQNQYYLSLERPGHLKSSKKLANYSWEIFTTLATARGGRRGRHSLAPCQKTALEFILVKFHITISLQVSLEYTLTLRPSSKITYLFHGVPCTYIWVRAMLLQFRTCHIRLVFVIIPHSKPKKGKRVSRPHIVSPA